MIAPRRAPYLAALVRKHSFPPVVDQRTRLLILGSLPGEESLRQRQYYAHPRNRFWELAGGALGIELRALGYEERLAALLARGVGLWDVIAHAERRGSLDGAIRNPAGNDLAALVRSLPRLSTVAFNGGRAAATGRALLAPVEVRLRLIDLPSSSPAYAAMPLPEKQSHWRAIADAA